MEETSNKGVIVGFVTALSIFFASLIGFGFLGDIAFYMAAISDDTFFDDDALKYFNASASTTNVVDVDDANLKDPYEYYLDNQQQSLAQKKATLLIINILINVIALYFIVELFFRKEDGILAKVRGIR